MSRTASQKIRAKRRVKHPVLVAPKAAPWLLLGALCFAGCGGDDARPIPKAEASAGVAALADFRATGNFWWGPFPNAHRRNAAGRPDIESFPNELNVPFLNTLKAMAKERAQGFGLTSTVYFPMGGKLSEGLLQSYSQSVAPEAKAYLVPIDETAGGLGPKAAVEVRFRSDGGPYGPANLLSLLPLQGAPLKPDTLYAAVLLRGLGDESGAPLGVSLPMAQLIAGEKPAGIADKAYSDHQVALAALRKSGVELAEIAALSAFRTGHPSKEFFAYTEDARKHAPDLTNLAFKADEVFPNYCVFSSTVQLPTYQQGTPPYLEEGGQWAKDGDGNPALQGFETARIVVTVPRGDMPSAGYPVVVFSRTGGGGDRPLVDRGIRAENGGPPVNPGTGPAQEFASVGYGGVSVDGPHGGPRNATGGDEQFLMFNVGNPRALMDNVRQSALELWLVGEVLSGLQFDSSSCPGAAAVTRFDPNNQVLMGHSMGATIAPLTLAASDKYRAGLLSGAGGSWIQNVIHKRKPLAVKPFAKLLLRASDYDLHEHDPTLALLQWLGEEADPPVYGKYIVHEPRSGAGKHVLMMQGVVDNYILPPIANATSLSFGLDLAGEAIDQDPKILANHPSLPAYSSLAERLSLVGRSKLPLGASGNAGQGKLSALVIQYPEGPIEDGHEVVFQTAAPKEHYRCFLKTLLSGLPKVLSPSECTPLVYRPKRSRLRPFGCFRGNEKVVATEARQPDRGGNIRLCQEGSLRSAFRRF